jgi:ATP-dependent DNA helicase MPH1
LAAAAEPLSSFRAQAPFKSLRQTTLFGRNGVPDDPSQTNVRRNWPLANKDEPPTHHKLNPEAIKTWVYPTNVGSIRDYQFNIVARGLFHNTLVALPTGLGKTFIAATIMLNWYRWTKDSQIIFVAPTKPLVAQQIDACFGIAGIPRSQTTALTGDVAPSIREDEWQEKRVFFMTPQTLHSDLTKGICDPKKVVLLVVDEAHRAKGEYAFVQVVKFIRRFNESFRVLALTATPGGDVEAVQEVIDGLDISRVEIRTDQSIDIREYVHDREVQKEVFRNSDEMVMLMDLYSKAVKPVMNRIAGINPSWSGDPLALTPFGCTKAKQTYMASDAGRHANWGQKGMVMSVFGLLASISQGMDLLKYHGISAAYHSWQTFKDKGDDDQSKSKNRSAFIKNENFQKMMSYMETWTRDPEFIGHPKLEYLRQVILNHLLDSTGGSTRIMVFSSFRDSAEEIARILRVTSPLIKPHVFVGQADSKNSKGMSQKKQLEVISKFKLGEYNTLIATSIGEEGLDIGEVDLIICFDSKASPLRMLQRMGRTGRKRAGKVVLLQMEGKEENDWLKAKDSYQHMQKEIANGDKFIFHEDRSRRILPRDVIPVVDKREVEIPIENTQRAPGELPTPPRKRRGKAKTKKKFNMPDGVETGFVTAAGTSFGTSATASIERGKQAPVLQDYEPVPTLESVYLRDSEIQTLEIRYQYTHIGADEDSYVLTPALDKYPEHQRQLGRTHFTPHGRVTKAFVTAMSRISDLDEYSAGKYEAAFREGDLHLRDTHGVLVSDVDTVAPQKPKRQLKKKPPPAAKATPKSKRLPPPSAHRRRTAQPPSSAVEAAESSPPTTDPLFAIRSQAIDLGSCDTPPNTGPQRTQEDSDLDGFVVGDDEAVQMDEDGDDDSLPGSSWLVKAVARGRNVTEKSASNECHEMIDDDDDLPDIEELVRGRESGKRLLPPRKRRVIDESDEDDL